MTLLTSRRLRAIVTAAGYDADVVDILRRHCVKFSRISGLDPDSFRIPCRTGSVVLSRRRSMLEIHGAAPVPYNPQEV